MFRVCHAFLSVHCSLVVTCWERANLLALLCVLFYCVFVTFPCGVLGQVGYLIVSISDFLPPNLLLECPAQARFIISSKIVRPIFCLRHTKTTGDWHSSYRDEDV